MHYREWLYTAWTRASEKAILLYTPLALRKALNKQKIKGSTLAQKVQAFIKLQGGDDGSNKVQLPDSYSLNKSIVVAAPRDLADSALTRQAPTSQLAEIEALHGLDKARKPDETVQTVYVDRVIERIVIVTPAGSTIKDSENEDKIIDAEWHDVDEATAPQLESSKLESSQRWTLPLADYNPNRWDGVAEKNYVYSLESPMPDPTSDDGPRGAPTDSTPVIVVAPIKKSLFANAVVRSK
jgi:hypothetical protein